MSEKRILTTIDGINIYRNFPENLPYNPHLIPLTRIKRKQGILSEVLFWQQVRNRGFHGIDFDRQRIIGSYIVDFYVKALGLVVEIDGNTHDPEKEYGSARINFLTGFGLNVFIISDWDVKHQLRRVMKDLENFIIEKYRHQ